VVQNMKYFNLLTCRICLKNIPYIIQSNAGIFDSEDFLIQIWEENKWIFNFLKKECQKDIWNIDDYTPNIWEEHKGKHNPMLYIKSPELSFELQN